MAGLQRTENELSQQTAAALGEFAAADLRAAIYGESILPKARDVLQVNQSLFAAGQSDFLVLLQAQRTLFDLELANIDAQLDRWQAAAKIAGLLQLEQFP
jgi:cobalt-zinc-cadmium efflux system outer membrane protein